MSISPKLNPFLPITTLNNLERADRLWHSLRHDPPSFDAVMAEDSTILGTTAWDLVICGGTLGIFLAASLQRRGWRVAVVERQVLRGRDQEWNISRQELQGFVELDLLSEAELEAAIATEYNPARLSFYQGYELWVQDILNIGVDPVFLLETLKTKFLAAGGTLLERATFQSATVHPDGVMVTLEGQVLTTRLLIDAMGHFSPIAKQARQGAKPDGVCLVVGSCAKGYPKNETGDLIASITPILNDCQYFWEAFPARDGRTTYLFTYLDADRDRFSLSYLMEEYLRLLPTYQGIELEKLTFERFLFGFFPAYRASPLRLPWNRVLAIGDSSGSQSPVSFGGFGAMVRHLERLTQGVGEALTADSLDRSDLALLQPYQPNIAVTWLFQQTMSVKFGQSYQPNQINDVMSGVFQVMDKLGDKALHPFLQDVIQLWGLSVVLPRVNPKLVLPLLPALGLPSLLDWSRHYLNLAVYSGLYPLGKGLGRVLSPVVDRLSPGQQYGFHRRLEAWKYGSGGDFGK